MKATRNFVPTPSAEETSTGSRILPKSARNMPPNEPISVRTFGLKVERASRLMRSFASFAASISTPESL
jgi:hypothetical protein